MNRKEILLSAFAQFVTRFPDLLGPDWPPFAERFFKIWESIRTSGTDLDLWEKDLWDFLESYPNAKGALLDLIEKLQFDPGIVEGFKIKLDEPKTGPKFKTRIREALDLPPGLQIPMGGVSYPSAAPMPSEGFGLPAGKDMFRKGIKPKKAKKTGQGQGAGSGLSPIKIKGVTGGLKAFKSIPGQIRLDGAQPPQPAGAPPEPELSARDLAAAEKDGYTEVPIFFATDRAPDDAVVEPAYFKSHRGEDRLTFGVAKVSVPNHHQIGEMETPPAFKFLGKPDPKEHILLMSASTLEKGLFLDEMKKAFSRANSKDVLVFIPGFSVSFKQAMRCAAQIAYDIRFPGLAMAYSWPSGDKLTKYIPDGDLVSWARPHLQEFLNTVRLETGAGTVHILAHSMGNRILVETLDWIGSQPPSPGEARIGHVIFAAPDVGKARFIQFLRKMRADIARRFTLYASSNDIALQASKKINDEPRAGDAGGDLVVVRPPLDTIDASRVDTSFLGHSYFDDSDSVVCDIEDLVRNDLPPDRRPHIQGVPRNGPLHWEFRTR